MQVASKCPSCRRKALKPTKKIPGESNYDIDTIDDFLLEMRSRTIATLHHHMERKMDPFTFGIALVLVGGLANSFITAFRSPQSRPLEARVLVPAVTPLRKSPSAAQVEAELYQMSVNLWHISARRECERWQERANLYERAPRL